jgi:hypothetical protein
MEDVDMNPFEVEKRTGSNAVRVDDVTQHLDRN